MEGTNTERDEVILKQFENLFFTSGAQPDQSVIGELEQIVSDEMNSQLLEDYTDEEIKSPVFYKGRLYRVNQMRPTKSPGSDGMSPIFYKKYWKIIGKIICGIVQSALQTGMFPPSPNHTYYPYSQNEISTICV